MKMLHIVSKSDGLYEVILVLCDRSLHRKVKGKFYGPIISPTNVMKDNHVLQKVQVAHIEDKMKEGRSRWFGHVMC